MEFNIKLSAEELRTVLDHLAVGQHNRVRGVIDNIVGQAQRQEVEAGISQDAPPADDKVADVVA